MATKTEKQEKFIRLAESRTNKIIDMLGLLGNLSNTTNYSYSEEQVNQIFDCLETELQTQREKFYKKQEPKKKKFRL